MKKEYNRNTMSDMPMDYSFNPSVEKFKTKTIKEKQKINAIGKKANGASKNNTDKKAKIKNKEPINQAKTELGEDLEKLNEENIKTYRYKSKRNKVVIILLAVALAIAITTVGVYIAISKLETNCNMIVSGANAKVYVGGKELKEFRAPSNLQNDSVLILNIQLKIEEEGEFEISFSPKCYQKGVLLSNTNVYGLNHDLFYEKGDGTWCSRASISGNQLIDLCVGITLDYYAVGLNVDNFRLDFYINLQKV